MQKNSSSPTLPHLESEQSFLPVAGEGREMPALAQQLGNQEATFSFVHTILKNVITRVLFNFRGREMACRLT